MQLTGNVFKLFPPRTVDLTISIIKKHSIVLMAIANANCEFIYCSVGTNGRVSDGGVLNHTKFYEKLINNDLKISEPTQLPQSNRVLEYVFVSDEAFAMRSDLIKPYNRDSK